MHRGSLHRKHRLAAVLLELMIDGLRIIIVSVRQPGKGSDAYNVAITPHNRNGFQQVLALVAIHDDATLRFEFPRTGIHIEHDNVHAEVHSCFLRAETGAKAVIEEHHEQGLILAKCIVLIAVGFYFSCFPECLLEVTKVFYIKETSHLLSFSLISTRRILPLMVLGNSSTNSMIRGYL